MDINNTTQDNSIFENVTSFHYDGYTNSTFDYRKAQFITDVVTCIIICIGLPLTLVAIYSLYSLVRNDHVAPIYVINLLISDLIQLCCMIYEVAQPDRFIISTIYFIMYNYSLMTSVCFMVCIALERYLLIVFPLWYRYRRTIKSTVVICIALERYLLIVFPLWYRYRRTIKSTVVICVVPWVLPALYFLTLFFNNLDFDLPDIIVLVLLLLPFPLLIFFCCATLKVLSATVSIPHDEKRRIVGTLILVLLIYTLLSLPYIIYIMDIYTHDTSQTIMYYLSHMFARLNPLADLVLYIFMKKGALDKTLASVCCCRVKDKDGSSLENTNGSS